MMPLIFKTMKLYSFSLYHLRKIFLAVVAVCMPLAGTALLSSCAHLRVSSPSQDFTVYITNTKKITLMQPACMSGSIDELQLLNGKYGITKFSMQAWVQSDSEKMNMELMNELGTGIGQADSPFFPKNMKAAYIVADFQFCFYDAEKIRELLSVSGLSFDERKEADGNGGERTVRTIRDGDKIIEQITKTKKTSSLKNNLRGYEYILQTVER
jgi:hypothetical protein